MRFSQITSIALLLLSHLTSAASDTTPPVLDPCTIHSSITGSDYDVRPLTLRAAGTKLLPATNESYHSRGYDYGANFSINICGPVVEDLGDDDVAGIPYSRVANISAFYRKDNEVFSLGQTNRNLTLRGRKLLLNYTGGSPCPELNEDGEFESRDIITPGHGKDKKVRRKSTLLSFICDTSLSLSNVPRISFLGSPDHCSYVFEVRSRYACAGATPSHEKGTLGPGGVFVLILVIGLLAYLVGGIVYQRNVMHQRGWKQLPNYSLWAGIFSFVSDMFQIIFGPCIRKLPGTARLFNSKRGGYIRVSDDDRRPTGRGRNSDAENRLIDDLNEEWDD